MELPHESPWKKSLENLDQVWVSLEEKALVEEELGRDSRVWTGTRPGAAPLAAGNGEPGKVRGTQYGTEEGGKGRGRRGATQRDTTWTQPGRPPTTGHGRRAARAP
jgi:hypothetical protein